MQQFRFDNVYSPKIALTKTGYMKGEAFVTRTGVLVYKNHDGSERRELRHPDDVFNPESLNSLKTIPITKNHPPQLVNVNNVNQFMVGMTGETVHIDGDNIAVSLNITHKEGIDAVNKGMKELSLGYNLDLLEESGEYEGETYTHRQTNIIYNHLSLVEKARAGRSARLNLDGYFIEETEINKKDVLMNNENSPSQVSEEMQARFDQSEEVIAQLKAKLEALEAVNTDSVVAESVNTRLALITKALKVINVDSVELSAKTDREIMEAVIKASSAAINLDGKSDAYVEARFDAVVETYTSNTTSLAEQMPKHKATANVDSYDKLEGKSGIYKQFYKLSRERLK